MRPAFSISTEENPGIQGSWKYCQAVTEQQIPGGVCGAMHPESLLGPDGLVEGVTAIALVGSLSPFPGSVPAVTAEFLPRSTESSAWTQGNNLL